MKVLLLKDVYKLGRAGDVKRVADGYGRNYLIPQGLAVLATAGALKQVDQIRKKAIETRAVLNKEMEAVAQQIGGVHLAFASRASETGKLYGSVTSQMVGEALAKKTGVEIARRQIEMQPLRTLGSFEIPVRLTVDLVPTITVIVHREGEIPEMPENAATEAQPAAEEAPEAAEAPVAEETSEVSETTEAEADAEA